MEILQTTATQLSYPLSDWQLENLILLETGKSGHSNSQLGVNCTQAAFCTPTHAAQRVKFAEKVHKPPLGFNVINFELNGLNASILVPWSPLDPKRLWFTNRNIQINKICVKKSCMFTPILPYNLLWSLWTFSSKLAECVPQPFFFSFFCLFFHFLKTKSIAVSSIK